MKRLKKALGALAGVAMITLASCAKAPVPEPRSPTPAPEPTGRPLEAGPAAGVASEFTGHLALKHVRYLVEEIGPRPAGSPALERACDYVVTVLEASGYHARKLEYALPGGKTQPNITAVQSGQSDEEIVLAGHLDTVPHSPGGNDDASGIGALLELAARLQTQSQGAARLPRSVRFLFLTAEEELEGFEGHGYSSIRFFESLPPAEVPQMVAACWLDKIAAGPTFKVIYIDEARDSLAQHLHELAQGRGMEPQLIAAKRWSKDMVFEDRDIPTAWLEYGPAPELHQPGDDLTHVDQDKLAAVGALVYHWLIEGSGA